MTVYRMTLFPPILLADTWLPQDVLESLLQVGKFTAVLPLWGEMYMRMYIDVELSGRVQLRHASIELSGGVSMCWSAAGC
jgi:hypothetical protein